jgi:hypothetical protein
LQVIETLAPPLPPDLIHQALIPLIDWSNDDDFTQGVAEIMPSSDMVDILTHLQHSCTIDKPTAGALFIRVMALLNFCQENDLPDTLFAEGLPGRKLCTAAAKLQVYREIRDEQHSAHVFAEPDVHAALKLASD